MLKKPKVVTVKFTMGEAVALHQAVWTMSTSADSYSDIMGAVAKLTAALEAARTGIPLPSP